MREEQQRGAEKPGTHTQLYEQTLHALHAIAAGDELFVSYLDVGLASAERRRRIQAKFGFDCHCGLCALSGAERAASDVRQERLAAIASRLAQLESTDAAIIKLTTERMRLLDREGLPRAWAYNDVIRCFNHWCTKGAYVKARGVMLEAIAHCELLFGDDAKTVRDLRDIIEER